LIRVQSFSYTREGLPPDPTGHGGGFVFDCRGLPNPGRRAEYAALSGYDEPVIAMLEGAREVAVFLEAALAQVEIAARAHAERGFQDLAVAFGCTGGRHRSVYCARWLGEQLVKRGWMARTVHWQLEREEEHRLVRRAMLLAAGFGTRLRPLTETTPKALVEAGGKPMLDWTLEAALRAGASEIVVNAHHHADQIEVWVAAAAERHPGVQFRLSVEREILGTGGGVRAAARWLHGPGPVLLHNADIWSDISAEHLEAARQEDDVAVLAVQRREASSYLLVDGEERVVGLEAKGERRFAADPSGEVKAFGFSGIHLLSHRFLELLPEGSEFGIMDAYLRMIGGGATVRAAEVEGSWFDMGTPDKLQRLDAFLAGREQ
jgi:dTDP-glucose pyrophosphorylase